MNMVGLIRKIRCKENSGHQLDLMFFDLSFYTSNQRTATVSLIFLDLRERERFWVVF